MSFADIALGVDSAWSLSPSLVAEITGFCDRVEDAGDAATAVVRLHGTGPGEGWPGPVGIDLVTRWEKALRRLERLPVAKIAAVEGVCRGAALEVLLTCDYRIAAPGLRIDVPVHNGSVWAGMVLHRLVAQFGGTRARQLVLFGAELSAERALEIGLVDEIAASPVEAAGRVAGRFAAMAPAELAIRRRLLFDAGVTSFEEALGMHLAACDRELRRAGGEPVAAARP